MPNKSRISCNDALDRLRALGDQAARTVIVQACRRGLTSFAGRVSCTGASFLRPLLSDNSCLPDEADDLMLPPSFWGMTDIDRDGEAEADLSSIGRNGHKHRYRVVQKNDWRSGFFFSARESGRSFGTVTAEGVEFDRAKFEELARKHVGPKRARSGTEATQKDTLEDAKRWLKLHGHRGGYRDTWQVYRQDRGVPVAADRDNTFRCAFDELFGVGPAGKHVDR